MPARFMTPKEFGQICQLVAERIEADAPSSTPLDTLTLYVQRLMPAVDEQDLADAVEGAREQWARLCVR